MEAGGRLVPGVWGRSPQSMDRVSAAILAQVHKAIKLQQPLVCSPASPGAALKMKCVAFAAAVLLIGSEAALLRGDAAQPIFKGKVNNDAQFATSSDASKPARAPGYRSAWDDCGGVGASATERMRSVAAKIKGWAKPLPFVRHAAQDCGKVDASGTKAGPGSMVNYPGAKIAPLIRSGKALAESTLR